jgi:tetratricopeptide (TPR) repeat protein
MKPKKIMHCSGKILAVALLLVVLAGIISVVSVSAFQGDTSSSLGKLKSMAEAQHEIVIILIKKQEYDKAAAEANKIFDMKWPGDQEPLLLKELLNLADAFLQQGQAPLGLKLVERNSKFFKKTSSLAGILKEMGYLLKSMSQPDKALEYFKKARDLEGGN